MPKFKGKEESVHLELFPEFREPWLEPGIAQEWEDLIGLREKVLKELEKAREQKFIGNSLEAQVILKAPAAKSRLVQTYRDELCALLIVSDVILEAGPGEELGIMVAKAPGQKCQRCWNYSTYVGTSASHPDFCKRCEDVVKGWPS
jgi:isoleucyl-tRNA synthetase